MKRSTWQVLDLGGSEDGVETYKGPSEQEARAAFAALVVAGTACRILCSATPGSAALRIVAGMARFGETA